MQEPKQKPKMDKPKMLDKSDNMVRSAGNLLTNEYRQAAHEKQARYTGDSPAEYGAGKLEHAVQRGAHLTGRAAAYGTKKAVRFVKEKRTLENTEQTRGAQQAAVKKTAAHNARDTRTANPYADEAECPVDRAKRTFQKHRGEAARWKQQDIRQTSIQNDVRQKQAVNRHILRQKRHENRLLRQAGVKAKSRSTAAKTAQSAKKKAQRHERREVQRRVQQQAVKPAKAAAKFTVRMAKLVANAGAALVKGLIALFGGVGAVLVIFLVVAMIAAVLCSPFGILYTDEKDGNMTMSDVIGTLSAEYYAEIQQIQDDYTYDTLEMTGAGINNWRDILAVYAVKTTTATDGTDVITMDEAHLELLRTVFWDMITIGHEIKETETTETVTSKDANGKEVTETKAVTKTTLTISTTCKTYSDMITEYALDSEQQALLEELMGEEYDEFFDELIGDHAAVIGGGGTGTISLDVYIWPSNDSNYITSFFGTRVHPIYGDVRQHTGIDIGASYGTDVLAADGGTVISSVWTGGYGNCIIIDHGKGNKTLYAHMSKLLVSAGQTVAQGQTIGLVGSTGNSTGPHLHFETYVNDSRVDPLQYFDDYTKAW